ncbi:MAG TPA: AI-2E family transporter [Candidatus Nanoarchaeia archaeon]|nr:AI-2E family transporter [Candidatus Nanoarchaeia archaeon]
MRAQKGVRRHTAFALIVVLFAIVGFGLLGYFEAVFAAVAFAPVLLPLYEKLFQFTKRRKIAAGLTILVVLVLIIIPLLFAATALVQEASILYNQYTAQATGTGPTIFGIDVRETVVDFIRDGIAQLRHSLANIVSRVIAIVVNIFIALFLLFYLLVHHEQVEKFVKDWLPFSEKHDWQFLANFKRTARGFVFGQGLTALIQGIVGTIGFLIFGVQGALFFGFVMALFALIPMIGTAIVWVPLGAFQLLLGNTVTGIGVLLWGALITSNIDNFVQPILMRNMIGVHPVVTILGIFSGLATFGLVGFVIGPLLLHLAVEAAKMFREEWYG